MNHSTLRRKLQEWEAICRVQPSIKEEAYTYFKALQNAIEAVKAILKEPPATPIPMSIPPNEIEFIRQTAQLNLELGKPELLSCSLTIMKLLNERDDISNSLRGQQVCSWLGLAERFFSAVYAAGGPEKSSEVLAVTYMPCGEVFVELGTYSIGDWPRHTYISSSPYGTQLDKAELDAFTKTERKVFEAEVVVKSESSDQIGDQ